MIKAILERLGRSARYWTIRSPFTNVYGLSRSLLAFATACTIAFNPSNVLFTPGAGFYDVPICPHGVWEISLYCVVSPGRLELARWISVAALIVIASGWRPRLTAIPHAWLSYSIFSSSTVKDGGDQITLVLTMLLLPLALMDSRRWHWFTLTDEAQYPLGRLIAWSSVLMVRIQVAAVYFVAGVSKLGQMEWANGTAMYYWMLYFDAPRWMMILLGQPVFVVAVTWGTLILEVALAAGLLLPKKAWRTLLVLGLIFHLMIALLLGLWSFSIAMTAALILYLHPADQPLFASKVQLIRAIMPGYRALTNMFSSPARS